MNKQNEFINNKNSKKIQRRNILDHLSSQFSPFFLSPLEKSFLSDSLENDWFYEPLIKSEFKEDEKNYYVEAELPGVKKEDIKVEVDELNNRLIIEAEKKQINNEKKTRSSDIYYGLFSRSYVLNSPVKIDEIDAKYENGVLFLSIPKTSSNKFSKIEIK